MMLATEELIASRDHTGHLTRFEGTAQKIAEILGEGHSYSTEEETRAILERKLKGLDRWLRGGLY